MNGVFRLLCAAVITVALFPIGGHAQATAARADAQHHSKDASQSWEAKACADSWMPEPDSPYWWRWRAYHNLDCIVATLDRHRGAAQTAKASGADQSTVTIPLAELDELRRMAFEARDAASRIER